MAQAQQVSKSFQNNSRPSRVSLFLGTALSLSLLACIGSITWIRFTQKQTIAKAQTLVANTVNFSNTSDIDTLKTTQNQLKQAVGNLEEITNIPGSAYQKAQLELAIIRPRLDTVEQNLKAAERLEELRPEAKAVLEQFLAVNSRLDVGMNYHDYSTQVGELKVALDRFSQQPDADTLPIYKSLKDAFKEYDFALDVWRYYVESDETHHFFPASSDYGSLLVQNYQVQTDNIGGEEYIYLNTALSTIWKRAGKFVKEGQGQI